MLGFSPLASAPLGDDGLAEEVTSVPASIALTGVSAIGSINSVTTQNWHNN
jgi:hypothetical protein